MTIQEALKKLNIEDYSERIFKSNSHGELGHLLDYLDLARQIEQKDVALFRERFVDCVNLAEKTWSRPESVFQYMPAMFGT